jgi:tetratricopeptide (TPR) repeat protein
MTSRVRQATLPNQQSAAARWLYGPWIDLVVGCAAWSAPLLLLTGSAATSGVRGWAVVFYALALAFNYPHYMATVYRAYHTRSEVARYRIFTLHLTALLSIVTLLTHVWSAILPLIFTLYVTWSPWHYTGQNFGLLMMFARRNGVAPSDRERRWLYWSFLASYLLLFVSFHTGASNDPLIISIGLPEAWSAPARLGLFVLFAGPGLVTLGRMMARAPLSAMVAPFMLFVAQFIWFVAPAIAEWASGVKLSQARYSSGVLAIMHSAQYLWVTSYYARREAESASPSTWRPWSYAAMLAAGGIALFVPGPWVASYLFAVDFTTSVLIFTAVVNIHHFILDGAIWKLRDSRIAAFLIDSQRKAAAGAAETGRALQGVTAWIVGSARSARMMRVAALAALVLWAAVDQARYLFATDATSLTSLSRAAALNPYDETVLARRERLLIEQKRFDELYDIYRSYISWQPDDPDARVRAGTIALQLGRQDEAIAHWQHALTQSPGHPEASGLLAQVWANSAERFDRENRVVDAATAYRQALTLAAAAGDRAAVAIDWFNYGQFLRRRGAEPRLVIASLLRAEALLAPIHDDRLETVREVRVAVEREHPAAAEIARKDPSAAEAALRMPVGAVSE